MFLNAFLTTYAIALGIMCAAATVVLAAALPYWMYANIKERLANKAVTKEMVREDNWPNNGPIGGWGE